MELMKKMIKTECGMEASTFGPPNHHPTTYPYHAAAAAMRGGGYVPPVAVPPHFYPPEIDVGAKFYHPGQRFPQPPTNMACKIDKDDPGFHGFMHPFGGGGGPDRQRVQGLLKPVYEMEKISLPDTLALPSPKVFTGQFDMMSSGGGNAPGGGCSNGDPLHFKQVSSSNKSVSDSDKRDKQDTDSGSKNFSAGCQTSTGGQVCDFVRKRDAVKAEAGSPFVGGGGADIVTGGGDFCGSHHQQSQLSGEESNGDDAFTTL
ncbi:hypothetical protein DMENIID0001_121200 [Sergentomyia squamirostris]